MIEDRDELDRRQRDLEDRERVLLEREEELSRRLRDGETSRPRPTREELDRPPTIVAESPRRSLAFLLIFLTGLGIVGWLLLRGGGNTDDASSKETMPFESRRNSGLNLDGPLTPAPVQPPQAKQIPPQSAVDVPDPHRLQEQELVFARQRAPILITHGMPQPQRTSVPASDVALGDQQVANFALQPNGQGLSFPDNGSRTSLESRQSQVTDPNSQFQKQLSAASTPVSVAARTPDRNYLVLQGKFIDATAETAINSDLPGQVRALVSYDVYAESGRRVMLPRGTRLIGEYNTAITKGQERLFVVWTRAIRPDGIDVALLSGGSDPLGRAGLPGEVDSHFWTIFGTSALLSIIGAGTATVGVTPDDRLNSSALYRAEIAAAFNRSAGRVLDKYLDIKPTIRIENGQKLKVFVARDLDFTAVLAAIERQAPVGILR